MSPAGGEPKPRSLEGPDRAAPGSPPLRSASSPLSPRSASSKSSASSAAVSVAGSPSGSADGAAGLGALRRLFQWGRRLKARRRRPRVRGRGLEFGAHRSYSAGDDLRSIDWTVYARLSRLVVRLMEDEPEPRLTVVLDTSPSMACGEPPCIEPARRAAAGVGAMAMGRGAELRLLARDGHDPRERYRGEARLLAMRRALERLEPGPALATPAPAGPRGGPASAGDSVSRPDAWLGRLGRRTRVALVTDGLDEALPAVVDQALHAGHELLVLLVEPARELPAFERDVAGGGRRLSLIDAESGRCAERSGGPDLEAAMRERRRLILAELGAELDRRGVPRARLPAEASIERLLPALMLGRSGLDGESGPLAGAEIIC